MSKKAWADFPNVAPILRERLRQALLDDGYDPERIDELVAEVEAIAAKHRERTTKS